MRTFSAFVFMISATTATAQERVTDPNGTVTGTFLGQQVAFDVACLRDQMFPNGASLTTHTPLSQSLIDNLTEDGLNITMFNGGAGVLANIAGEPYMKVKTGIGDPTFPMSLQGDDFDLTLTCPDGF